MCVVSQALIGVNKVVDVGCRVVFEEGNSYIGDVKCNGKMHLKERGDMHFIKISEKSQVELLKVEQMCDTRLGKFVSLTEPGAATSEQKLREDGEGVRDAERDLDRNIRDTQVKGQPEACSKVSLLRAATSLGIVDSEVIAIGDEAECEEKTKHEDQHPDKGLVLGCSTDGLDHELAYGGR